MRQQLVPRKRFGCLKNESHQVARLLTAMLWYCVGVHNSMLQLGGAAQAAIERETAKRRAAEERVTALKVCSSQERHVRLLMSHIWQPVLETVE